MCECPCCGSLSAEYVSDFGRMKCRDCGALWILGKPWDGEYAEDGWLNG